MSKSVNIEIFDVNDLNGDRRLNLHRKEENENIEVSVRRFDKELKIEIEEKEALELASHIFRQVLGLY